MNIKTHIVGFVDAVNPLTARYSVAFIRSAHQEFIIKRLVLVTRFYESLTNFILQDEQNQTQNFTLTIDYIPANISNIGSLFVDVAGVATTTGRANTFNIYRQGTYEFGGLFASNYIRFGFTAYNANPVTVYTHDYYLAVDVDYLN